MNENWNLPNVLTTVRILLVPFFVWFLAAGGPAGEDSLGMRWAAFAVFAVAMYTDKLDGDIARARGLVTSFGKIADPIADKLLTGAAFIVLSMLGELWWWVTILILLREWGITLMRFVVLRYGVMPASRGGKLKTVLQAGALLLMLAPLTPLLGDWYPWVGWTAMGAALAVTLVTGADYVLKAVRLRRSALAGGARP
ncbi:MULTISPECIES: CDP-alcohol phosphatidyltransferase family protein [Citricoccus]|uniref:CDP-alcohol phosphatidyltransferase family protein n=1 Tax=Citricoccus TaxID=169133 RepID=UPI000255E06F|nr:CDP-alcohol phosphatidyltransferase family protein [Citricoccus sp. CH26A]